MGDLAKFRIALHRWQLKGKIPAGDPRWGEFNDLFDNLTMGMDDVAKHIAQGYAYTTWHSGRRSLDNFICAQHIAVDMDTEDGRSTFAVLLRHEWVRMFGGIIHTSPSHTEDKPRARVIFFLDQIIDDATAYQTAAKFLISQFDGADTSVSDASRFFYGCMGGQIEVLGGILPVGVLRRYYRLWMRNQPKQDKQGAPVIKMADRKKEEPQPDELQKLKDALSKIDPWGIDYNKWIGIIAACKREVGESAFSIVEQWAKGKPGEVKREWDRLKDSRQNAAHLGTVYYLANGGR